MRKEYAWLLGGLLIGSSLFISYSCKKETTDDDDIVGNWKKIDVFGGDPRSEAISFNIGNLAYVGTGATSTERFKDLWEYDAERRSWKQKADMPADAPARNSAVAFSIDGKGYVGTGYDGTNRLNDFWAFDPVSNQWDRKADFAGGGRYDAVGFAAGGKGYIACGYDTKALNTMWQYDPASNNWNSKASVLGDKRSAAIAFVINNTPYVMAGINNGEVQRDIYAYDAAGDKWIEKTKIYNYSEESFDDDYGTIGRQNGVAFSIGNFAYITTGENGSITSTTWRYDPSTDSWLEKTGFEGTGRSGSVAFSINNRGFVFTGRSGSLVFDNGYELMPEDDKVDGD
jgi:N-acetylneuraminic acid mutarotase